MGYNWGQVDFSEGFCRFFRCQFVNRSSVISDSVKAGSSVSKSNEWSVEFFECSLENFGSVGRKSGVDFLKLNSVGLGSRAFMKV